MTGGFATIAGGVLAAYISFGVPASHLLSASVMSAPAALAISKLMYPETEESETKNGDEIEVAPMYVYEWCVLPKNNFLEANYSRFVLSITTYRYW